MTKEETIRVFVGADTSQQAAIGVLEYSIKKHTNAKVEVVPMIDLDVPRPKDPRNWQRTGFSFSRFCIPKLCNYQGKAIYMDADMQVFKDIRGLWNIPFNGAKVLIQSEVKNLEVSMNKTNTPQKRIKQCAVMLLDCSKLDWDINTIVDEMDAGLYGYKELMYEMSILSESEIGYSIPFEWNSLEYFDHNTALLHYTDMGTQPWVSNDNPLEEIWINEVRQMIKEKVIDINLIVEEVKKGYFRPSLINDLKLYGVVPKQMRPIYKSFNRLYDKLCKYEAHKMVYIQKRALKSAILNYERENGIN